MREFRIIFVQNDASGIMRPDIAKSVMGKVYRAYGGFTVTEGVGGYLMKTTGKLVKEPVYIFDVATAKTPQDILFFVETLASAIKADMGQESIYFRNVDGMVHLL
jgi:hypothetical protein